MVAITAALVALLVATVVNVWQRHVEHVFLLRKEKREIFRDFLGQAYPIMKSIGEADFAASEPFLKAAGKCMEARLICSERLMRSMDIYMNNVVTIRNEVMTQGALGANMKFVAMKMSEWQIELTKDMQAELRETVSWKSIAARDSGAVVKTIDDYLSWNTDRS